MQKCPKKECWYLASYIYSKIDLESKFSRVIELSTVGWRLFFLVMPGRKPEVTVPHCRPWCHIAAFWHRFVLRLVINISSNRISNCPSRPFTLHLPVDTCFSWLLLSSLAAFYLQLMWLYLSSILESSWLPTTSSLSSRAMKRQVDYSQLVFASTIDLLSAFE